MNISNLVLMNIANLSKQELQFNINNLEQLLNKKTSKSFIIINNTIKVLLKNNYDKKLLIEIYNIFKLKLSKC